jgi:hypothetical protein
MIRAANVLKFHKECYATTKHPLDRAQLESGVPHGVKWMTMLNTYNTPVDHLDPNFLDMTTTQQ